jgi:hypothetical protein
MVKGDQKMMLKRVLVTAFACLFVMAFGLGQVAYGADGAGYSGTLKMTGKIYGWDTKADNEKFKKRFKDVTLITSNGFLYIDKIVTEDDGNYTCEGESGQQAFCLECCNWDTADDNSTTHIWITGKYKETEKGKLKFKGKGCIDKWNYMTDDWIGVGRVDEMKGNFLPVVAP